MVDEVCLYTNSYIHWAIHLLPYTYVTGSAKIDHVSANFTELYFGYVISSIPHVVSHFRTLQKKAH